MCKRCIPAVSYQYGLFKLMLMGAPGVWGSWEKGYLLSGSWGALVIILGEKGSKLVVLWI